MIVAGRYGHRERGETLRLRGALQEVRDFLFSLELPSRPSEDLEERYQCGGV